VIGQESDWLAKAVRGDQEAFTALVEAYQGPVYNLCYRMLGDANEAEDAAQETFLRAYRNMQRYDFQRAFSTWILSIAAHYCIDQIRRRRFTVMSFDDSPEIEPPDTGPGPEKVALMNEDQRKVQALLAGLQPQDRAAILMRYWYDFSYEEIAESLSTTIPAVKSRLHRARNELALRWTDQGKSANALGRNQHGEAKSSAVCRMD
jgi:RNA polymerase sigma-70 factor (ECF subfamily)